MWAAAQGRGQMKPVFANCIARPQCQTSCQTGRGSWSHRPSRREIVEAVEHQVDTDRRQSDFGQTRGFGRNSGPRAGSVAGAMRMKITSDGSGGCALRRVVRRAVAKGHDRTQGRLDGPTPRGRTELNGMLAMLIAWDWQDACIQPARDSKPLRRVPNRGCEATPLKAESRNVRHDFRTARAVPVCRRVHASSRLRMAVRASMVGQGRPVPARQTEQSARPLSGFRATLFCPAIRSTENLAGRGPEREGKPSFELITEGVD